MFLILATLYWHQNALIELKGLANIGWIYNLFQFYICNLYIYKYKSVSYLIYPFYYLVYNMYFNILDMESVEVLEEEG